LKENEEQQEGEEEAPTEVNQLYEKAQQNQLGTGMMNTSKKIDIQNIQSKNTTQLNKHKKSPNQNVQSSHNMTVQSSYIITNREETSHNVRIRFVLLLN
jgi:hypothetical protein